MKRDLYKIAEYLYEYLIRHGIRFNNHGYPVIPEKYILKDEPEAIFPYTHRLACDDKSKTVICHFENDERLYPRLDTLKEDVEKLKGFMGVGGFDLSPRREFDRSLQEFNLLINRMIDAYRAVNGIKILPNLRTGGIDTIKSLSSYPVGANYLVGSLGCSKRLQKQSDILLRAKLLYTRPGKLFIYGSLQRIYKDTLDDVGQEYKQHNDFRNATWTVRKVA